MKDDLNVVNQSVEIGRKLKDYFNKNGYTQQYIAEKLGVSQAAVSALLNGKPFGKKLANKWAEEFGLRVNWLLTNEGEMFIDDKTEKVIKEITPNIIYDMFVKSGERIVNVVEEITSSNKTLVDTNVKLVDTNVKLVDTNVKLVDTNQKLAERILELSEKGFVSTVAGA